MPEWRSILAPNFPTAGYSAVRYLVKLVNVVVDNEGSVDVITGTIADLAEGALVVNFGAEDVGDCFDADTIISREPPVTSDVTWAPRIIADRRPGIRGVFFRID